MLAPPQSPRALVDAAARALDARFASAPRWAAAAPGRVNLIGEHTDYTGGFVLPMAIDRYTAIAAAPGTAAGLLRVHSLAIGETVEIPVGAAEPPRAGPPAWANYVRGVVAIAARRGLGAPPLDAVIASDVPLGGGLSSSAALEVATATLLEAVAGRTLPPVDKARLCREAEHEYAGVPCGLMDQLASVLGDPRGALLIDCRAETARLVAIDDPAVTVLMSNTNVRHALGDGAYAQRRADCEEAARLLGVPSLRDATAGGLRRGARRVSTRCAAGARAT